MLTSLENADLDRNGLAVHRGKGRVSNIVLSHPSSVLAPSKLQHRSGRLNHLQVHIATYFSMIPTAEHVVADEECFEVSGLS